ncbi:MAG: RagB/SusD family nutrient uptake outer membrane protein, partial [Bacteroidales bacterium]|nr:RagB/SusD family nutrient uptake outer membrane protein [Bacteroidales bacterium]
MNRLKYFTALGLLMIFSYSCEDFFYVDDREKLTEEIVINKENDVKGMWANLYHYLENGFTFIDNALLANACDEADMNNPGSQVYKYNNGSWNAYDNPDNRYNYYFTALRNAMNFLKLTDTLNNPRFAYESYRVSDPVKFNTLKRELKAYRIDAKFFSAYYHFELWKRFGEIPVITSILTDSGLGNLERNSSEDIVSHIVTLLDEIIPEFDELELMPESEYLDGAWNGNNIGRITKGAALALKSRTLLYASSPLNNDGLYNASLCDLAARAAADIINMGIYSAGMDYRSIHQDKSVGNKENILDMRVGNQDFNYLEAWNVPPGGNKAFITPDVCRNATCPSQNLVDAYETVSGNTVDEQKPYEDRDPRLKMSILTN